MRLMVRIQPGSPSTIAQCSIHWATKECMTRKSNEFTTPSIVKASALRCFAHASRRTAVMSKGTTHTEESLRREETVPREKNQDATRRSTGIRNERE